MVSTDYDQYAILYSCSSKTTMYNRDHVTVLVRNSPAVVPVSDELLKMIRDEWERIFGQEGTEKQNTKKQ